MTSAYTKKESQIGIGGVTIICPSCGASLRTTEGVARCTGCGTRFQIHHGILRMDLPREPTFAYQNASLTSTVFVVKGSSSTAESKAMWSSLANSTLPTSRTNTESSWHLR